MVLRDGSFVDDLLYDGGNSVTVKIWDECQDCGRWEVAPLTAMPREWLEGVRGAVESALHPAEKSERSTAPGSLLSQWWSLGRIICDKRTSGRHVKAAWVIIDRHVRSHGNSRASLRYIERATGLGRDAVIRACRELTEWGYVQRRIGSGTRPSEYTPHWTTTARGPQNPTTNVDHSCGVETPTSCGAETPTSIAASGVEMPTESYLPSPAYSPADGISNVSANGPGADAPAAAGEFERIWRAYGRHGSKPARKRAFAAIINPDIDHIAERAAAWAASAKPSQRRMPLEKWLEQERYDEADRNTQRASAPKHSKEPEDTVRRNRRDADDAAESAEAWSAIRRATIEIDAPRGVELTALESSVEARGCDKWLVVVTNGGRVGVLLEGGNAALQEEGQGHVGRLADSCGVEINDAVDLIGRTFMIAGDTFAAPMEKAA